MNESEVNYTKPNLPVGNFSCTYTRTNDLDSGAEVTRST